MRGAFTGAVANKPGKFQAADGGTLFLDEIGEMPLELQVKLLRALQEQVVVRVGDNRPETVDIRIVAATNRDLEDEIKARPLPRGSLLPAQRRATSQLPPLRERGEDIVVHRALPARHATRAEYGGKVQGLHAERARRDHASYRWPGNIRELENRIKKAVVLCRQGAARRPRTSGSRADELPPILPLAEAKEKFQREYINEVLELQQRQPHQDRARSRRRSAHHLPPPRKRGRRRRRRAARCPTMEARRLRSPMTSLSERPEVDAS